MNDRCRGTLIGLAVGDALGAAVEFRSPGSFTPVTGYRGGGPHGLDPREWTDDTSMALALADSIATTGWDLNDQADRYVEWWKTGKYSVNGRCFDIGITTRSALVNYVAKKDPLIFGRQVIDSEGVLDLLIDLCDRCHFVPMIVLPQTIHANKATKAIMLASNTKQPVWLAFCPPDEVPV